MTGQLAQRSRWRDWVARFGWAEVCGTAGSYAGYFLLAGLGAHAAAGSYGAAIGENCGYYGLIFLRDWRGGGLPARKVLRDMVHDFGVAELLDSLVVRPGITFWAVTFAGPLIGIGLGKIAADMVFYILAIAFYERRRAREGRR